jgi:IS5 family transposase
MQGKKNPQRSFLDAEIEKQTGRPGFLERVEAVMDWSALEPYWGQLYRKTGKPSHPPLVTFKMLLLQHWFNGLSDEDVEWQCRDRLSFRKFLGVSRAEDIPDSNTLVRFRKRLVLSGVMQAVFDAVTVQLEAQQLLLKRGTLVDATIVQSARTPPPKWEDQDARDTCDPDARWASRNSRAITHGYKVHVAVDQGSELIRALSVTPGSVHDSTQIDALLSADTQAVYADKAYDSAARRAALRAQGIEPRILHSPRVNRPLSQDQQRDNWRWIPVRAQVERIFADWKQRRSLRRARYVGLARNTLHAWLLATAHNLRRWTVLSQAWCL